MIPGILSCEFKVVVCSDAPPRSSVTKVLITKTTSEVVGLLARASNLSGYYLGVLA